MHFVALAGIVLAAFAVQASAEQTFFSDPTDVGSQAADQSLLWGTYRPGLYFGLKPRLAGSLMTGTMWYGANDFRSFENVRHECDQRDGMSSYTFTEHDGRSAAAQVVEDKENNLHLTFSWLKLPGEKKGGSWAYRVQGRPLVGGKAARTTFVNYFGHDGSLGFLELESDYSSEGIEGDIQLNGRSEGLGDFAIRIEDHATNPELTPGRHVSDFGSRLSRTQFLGESLPPGQIWQAKDVFKKNYALGARELVTKYGQDNLPDPALLFALPNTNKAGSNLYMFQRTYEGHWGIDVFFDSKEVGSKLDGQSLTAGLAASSRAFADRFARTFPLAATFSEAHQRLAKHVTSNLLGGIGFFHGPSLVDRTPTEELMYGEPARKDPSQAEVTGDMQLLTATPSRAFFPRGFYWDEGFHLLHVGAWDNDLSLEILKSWIGLIDEQGWVAREQILGAEARARVPAEFQAQYPSHANPPTLVLAVTAYIERLKAAGISLDKLDSPDGSDSTSPEELSSLLLSSPQRAAAYLKHIYAPLRRHYLWFRRVQRGSPRQWGRPAQAARRGFKVDRNEGYRWNGRTADHVLTSGLDDYPRAAIPHEGEMHVDLLSWVGSFARTMGEIAQFLGEEYEEDREEYEEHLEGVLNNLEALHWSSKQNMYCDVSVNGDDESVHVCNAGYVSLFPLLLGLLPPSSPHIEPLLKMMTDEDQLWSPAGIRSLSKAHPLYGKGENYWRGPVWMPMNFLALRNLFLVYAKEPGPSQTKAAQVYDQLRTTVVENMLKESERTGFVWEQYHPITGEGQRSHAFTGWSSLYALILAEQY